MSAPEAFENARAKFLSSRELNHEHKTEILQITSIEELYDETDRLQKEHAKSRKQRYLAKIKPFLLCLEQYSQVVEVFVQVQPSILALIWGPIKLLLKMSNIYISSFEKLLSVLASIGDCLPQFNRYTERFRQCKELHYVLALFYEDILDVYLESYKYVKGHIRKALVELLWPKLATHLERIQSNINAHKDLFTREVTLNVIIDAQNARKEALEHYEKVRESETAEKLRTIECYLSPTLYEGRIGKIKEQRCGGTGSWLKNTLAFKRWLDPEDQSAAVIWLTGIPGAGKSFLCWDIATWLESRHQGVNLATSITIYAFLSDSEQDERAVLSVIHSFVYQIFQTTPELLQVLLDHYDSRSLPSVQLQNQEFAISVLQKLIDSSGNVYMLLDGLDEYPEPDRQMLLSVLLRIRKKCSNLRLLVSSRSEADISKSLKSTAKVIEIGKNNCVDIGIYVKTQSSNLLDKFGVGHSTDQRREILTMLQQIADKAEGMFLYARLVMNHLQGQMYLRDIKREAENLPTGLGEAYQRILNRIESRSNLSERSHIKRLFQWLFCAKRPLREIELQHALICRPGDRLLDGDGVREDWLDICGPIIERRGGTIVFVHFTAKEYLKGQESGPFLREDTAHAYVADICLTYLNLSYFGHHLSDEDMQQHILKGAYALFDYANDNWLHHIEDSTHNGTLFSGDPNLVASLQAFFGDQKNAHFCPSGKGQLSGSNKSFESLGKQGEVLYDTLCEAALHRYQMKHNILYDEDLDWINKDPFLTSSTLVRIRRLRESLASTDKAVPQTAALLRDLYDTRLFKCTRLACQHFSLGFDSLQQREDHMRLSHNRPFKCSNPHCDMSRIGFTALQSLKKHEDACQPRPKAPVNIGTATPLITKAINVAHINESSRWQLLCDAVHSNDVEMVAHLVDLGIYEDQTSSIMRDSLLVATIKSGSTAILDLILQERLDKLVNFEHTGCRYAMAPLQIAALYGQEEIAKRLLERGSQVECRSDPWSYPLESYPPLAISCREGYESLVKLLLDFGADPWAVSDHHGENSLVVAISNRHEAVVRVLLAFYPMLIHQRVRSQFTPLHLAIMHWDHRVVGVLLEHGSDVEAECWLRGETLRPLQLPCNSGRPIQLHWKSEMEKIIQLLISRGADINPPGRSVLELPVLLGAVSAVEMLVAEGADVNYRDQRGGTHLYHSCLKNNQSMITALIKNGAKLEPRFFRGPRETRNLRGFIRWAKKNPELAQLAEPTSDAETAESKPPSSFAGMELNVDSPGDFSGNGAELSDNSLELRLNSFLGTTEGDSGRMRASGNA